MNQGFRVIVGAILTCVLFSMPSLSEVLWNDSADTATGLRVVFDQPVEITGYGDILLQVSTTGTSHEFMFSGDSVEFGFSHWLTWTPCEAAIVEYEWLYGDPLQQWNIGFGFDDMEASASVLAEAVRFDADNDLLVFADCYEKVLSWPTDWWRETMIRSDNPHQQKVFRWDFDAHSIVGDGAAFPDQDFFGAEDDRRSWWRYSYPLLDPAGMQMVLYEDEAFKLASIDGTHVKTLPYESFHAPSSNSRVVFSPSGGLLAIMDGTHVTVWATNKATLRQEIELPELPNDLIYRELVFSTDGNLLSTVGSSNGASFMQLVVLDAGSGTVVEEFRVEDRSYSGVVSALSGQFAVALSNKKEPYALLRFNLVTGENWSERPPTLLHLGEWNQGARGIFAVPNSSRVLVVGDRYKTIYSGGKWTQVDSRIFLDLWDIEQGMLLWSGEADGGYFGSLAISRDGSLVAVVAASGDVIVWELP